jgi:hypothetical protein
MLVFLLLIGLLAIPSVESLAATRGQIVMTSNRNVQKPTWGFLSNRGTPSPTVLDVVSVLGRFQKREDFYKGIGYRRPAEGLLTNITFYDNISKRKFNQWPKDSNGVLVGSQGMDEKQIAEMKKALTSGSVSVRGCEAVFTSFAKGATNGVAYPKQVDEEMARWLSPERVFNLNKFEESLILGKLWVFVGWFLYIGLQFGGVYIVFFVPFAQQFFPDVDFYPVQTALHTSEWGK